MDERRELFGSLEHFAGIGEEGRKGRCLLFLDRNRSAQNLRQPSNIGYEPFGFGGHIFFLHVRKQIGGVLAFGVRDGLDDLRFRDARKVVLGARDEACSPISTCRALAS